MYYNEDMVYVSLLQKIKEIRKRQGLSLQDLGEKLGVSGQYVSMIERGKAPLKMDDYFQICKILGVSAAKLLIDEEGKKASETLAEKIYALSERDFKLLTTMIELLQ